MMDICVTGEKINSIEDVISLYKLLLEE